MPNLSFGGRIKTAAQALVPGGVEPGVACPPGYHAAKDGSGRCVRNRRMNPGNARALRRSIRRESSFIKLAQRTGLVALPKATRTRKKARKR
jgi:hypothetical protein